MPDGETASELTGKRQQIQFDRQSTVISLLGLLQPAEMVFERGFGLPGGAVDPL